LEEPVDPGDLEGEVGVRARAAQRVAFLGAGLLEAAPRDERRDGRHDRRDEERHRRELTQHHRGGDRPDRGDPTEHEPDVAEPFVLGLSVLEDPVTPLDLLVGLGVFGRAPGGLRDVVEAILAVLDLPGDIPEPTLVHVGQGQDVRLLGGAGGEIRGDQAHLALGDALVQPGLLEQVHRAPVVEEQFGHVLFVVHVDHAVAAADGPEDRVATPAVRDELEVHARSSRAQRADHLVDQPVAFEATHAADDGESCVQVQ